MSNSDFYFRVLNFSIFAGLLIYLIATPLKEFFKGRSSNIESRLGEIEAKLEHLRKRRESYRLKGGGFKGLGRRV